MLERRLRPLTVLLCTTACGEPLPSFADAFSGPAGLRTSQELREAVAARIELAEEERVRGSYALARGGERIIAGGVGECDRLEDIECGADTVYDITGLTRAITASAVLALAAEGKLSLEDRLGTHVAAADGELADVSVHQLLTDSAGLAPDLAGDRQVEDWKDFVDDAGARLDDAQVGEFRESELGYALLAGLVDSIEPEGYEAYLRRIVFERVGMHRTGYAIPKWELEDIAAGYYGIDNSVRAGTAMDASAGDDGPTWPVFGSTGMMSTVEDIMLWHLALRGEVVDPSIRQWMFHPALEADDGFGVGYGWRLWSTELGVVAQAGNTWNGTFESQAIWVPEHDVFAVVLSPGSSDDTAALAFELARLALGLEPTSDPED